MALCGDFVRASTVIRIIPRLEAEGVDRSADECEQNAREAEKEFHGEDAIRELSRFEFLKLG
jgi:hypothetical protein